MAAIPAAPASPPCKLTVDCANGVGAPKLAALAPLLRPWLDLTLVNTETNNAASLNYRCGADYVKTRVLCPDGVAMQPGRLYASLDGDADRIVFYALLAPTQGGPPAPSTLTVLPHAVAGSTDPSKTYSFVLLDGDRIAALAAAHLVDAGAPVGVVQTAYANGAATRYIRDELAVPVVFASTGVKNLHAKAVDFAVGVYFEANGHGTAIFNSPAVRAKHADVASMINETVGDAISDMLLVCAILARRSWTAANWAAAYTDLPSRLVRVVVKDREAFKTIDADTRLIEPAALQKLVEVEIAAAGALARSFVRPSGTEDVVRVYAEAETRESCDRLAFRVAGIVFDSFGGVGVRPREFL